MSDLEGIFERVKRTSAGVWEKTPPLVRQFKKGASRPFSVVPSLPFVPVVSPPVGTGAHGRAQAMRSISAVFDTWMCRILSRTPRDPGACHVHFLARCRRGRPVGVLPLGLFMAVEKAAKWETRMTEGNPPVSCLAGFGPKFHSCRPSDAFIPIRFIVIHLTAAVKSDDKR